MYLLKDETEHIRLDKQNATELYSVASEIIHLTFSKSDFILDAGCGSGSVTESLIMRGVIDITGVDGSIERIKHFNKKFSNEENINGIVSKLEELPFKDSSFDKVICRFVLHHQKSPQPIMEEFLRVLRPGGMMIIIDSDGIMFNIYSSKYDFSEVFSILKEKLPLDLFVGRKIKPTMDLLNMQNASSKMIPMHFTGTNLKLEREQYIDRFSSMDEFLVKIIGKSESKKFIKEYLDALNDPATELFYNKFVTMGVKQQAMQI